MSDHEAKLWYYRVAVVFLLLYAVVMHSFWFGRVEEEVAEQTQTMKAKLAVLTQETDTTIRQSVALLRTELHQVRIDLGAVQHDAAILKRYRCP